MKPSKALRFWAGLTMVLLCAGMVQAQLRQRVLNNRLTPPMAFDDSPLALPRVFWKNGELLDGELLGGDEKSLSFKSDLFDEPVPLFSSAVDRVEFPPPVGRESPAPFQILLKNGDCLFADITAINADGLITQSTRHGSMKLPLAAVQSVRRSKSDKVLYNGPHGAEGWKHYGLRDVQGFPWASGERGSMMTRVWNRSAMMEMELPDKFEADVVLDSTSQLRFALSFGQASNSSQVMAIETWDDELVIAQQNRFTPLRTLKPEDHFIALRICYSRSENRVIVHDWNGNVLGEFKSEPSVQNIKPCVLVRNKGPQLTLEQLTVRQWDGAPLAKRELAQGFIEKLDGTIASGAIAAGSDGKSFLAGAANVPLDQLLAMDAGPVDAKKLADLKLPLAQMLIEVPKLEAMPTRVRYSDGTLLSGQFAGIKDGAVNMRHVLLPQPIVASLNNMSRLTLHEAEVPGTPAEVALDKLDTMHVGQIILHGVLEGTGDARLRWRLPGSTMPVALAKRTDLEIRRPMKTDVPPSPALFFLKDGNVLGAKLQIATPEEIKISSDVAEVNSLKPDQLNAIHFNSRKLVAHGFDDAGWQVIKGSDNDIERRGTDTVVIKGTSSFGHSTILAGDEVSFTMSAPSFWGALAVELFVGDLESHAKTPQVHFIFSGSDFWAVLESGENNSRSSEQLRNLTSKSINVRLVFTEDSMQVFANNIPLMSSTIEPSLRKGPGIIFAPSAMWGNPSRDVQVSNFAVNARPDFLQVPSVGEESKRQALTIPRFKRTSPPTHVLLAPNGDVLRGRIEGATSNVIKFTSGLDSIDMPVDRVSAAVWLDEPKKSAKDDKTPAKEPSKDDNFATAVATHWVVLQDGSRLGLKVDKFMADKLLAWSPSLGNVTIPLDRLAVLKLTAPAPSAAMLAYRGWQPEFAPEPVLPETGGQSSPLLGKPAPDFALPLLGGGQFQLSAEKGKFLVLDFWATWCGPCVASIPEQLKAMAGFDPAQVKFLFVNQGEPEAVVQKFLQTRGWQLPVALDSQQAIGAKYGADSIPHCVVIGPDGKVVWTNSGYEPGGSEKMAAMIRKLMGGGQ